MISTTNSAVNDMLIHVFYEVPIVEWSDINTKEEEAYRTCYESTVKPTFTTKSVAQVLSSIANSCSSNHKGIYIGVENERKHLNQMNLIFKHIQQFLISNHPQYSFDTNTVLASKSRVWYTRIAIELICFTIQK
jgi:hypothetical protein